MLTGSQTGTLWGETVARREGTPAFLMYEPRCHHVAELLKEANRFPEREFLVQGERRLTFRDVLTAVPVVAAHLREVGLQQGDRLLVLAHNSPEWVIVMLAVVEAGGIVATGNGWWSASEAQHAAGLVTPSVIVTDARRRLLLAEDETAAIVDVEDVRRWVEGAIADPIALLQPSAHGDEDDPAIIIFTAGTTGAPKAVTLAHRSIIMNLHSLLAVSGRLPHQLDLTREPAVALQSGPLFHVGGVQSTLLALLNGNTMVFLKARFDAGEVLDLLESERVTIWGAVPTMVVRVLQHPSVLGRDLSAVRSVSLGGAPVQPALTARMREVFPSLGRGISTIYGLTETGGTVASASGALMAEHPSTSGPPAPIAEFQIASPDADGTGEILVRTPGQMLGYWGDDTSGPIDELGWVHTGDLGRFHEGLLYVTGRSKDVIIRGGENIAAVHVETALMSHPDVAAVAVVGLPDEDLGEVVAAAVQLRAGGGCSLEQLAAHAATSLAAFELPQVWWLLEEEMPMTEAGKINKIFIRANWPTDKA